MSEMRPPSTTASPGSGGTVAVGSRVRVRDSEGDHEQVIVGRVTAATAFGCVSETSPVGRALIGRRAGERVQVHTPGGTRQLTIVDVVDGAAPSPPGRAHP